jgi:hypothetical protein
MFEIIRLASSQPAPSRNIFPPAPAHLAVALLCAWLAFSSTACAQAVSGNAPASGTPAAKPPSKGEDPLHRDSPQSAVLSFLADYRARNFTEEFGKLDVKHLPQDQRVQDGQRLAK